MKKKKKKNNNEYKGVRMRSWGSWVSEIRAPNQKTRIWLGSYSTPQAAARAYDAALLCLKGSSANLNFPHSKSKIPTPPIMSPKSIQRIAAAAAAATDEQSPVDDHLMSATPPSPLPPPPPPPPADDVDYWYSCFDGSSFLDPPSMMIQDYSYDEGHIPLWSFC